MSIDAQSTIHMEKIWEKNLDLLGEMFHPYEKLQILLIPVFRHFYVFERNQHLYLPRMQLH